MPNAKDLSAKQDHLSILLVGVPGSGKTTQFNTLPGKGFIYVFDQSCLASIEGMDVDYETFYPSGLNWSVNPLRKDAKRDVSQRAIEPRTYMEFEEHFDNFLDGKIKEYDWIGFDSLTTLQDMVMDRTTWLNGHFGKQPEQDDWSAQMIVIQALFREITARGKLVITTAHEEPWKDEVRGGIFWQILVTGKLKTRMPLLFSNVLRCETEDGKYFLVTQPDKKHPFVRCSFKGLEADIPGDIDFKSPPYSKYGIGKILLDAGYFSNIIPIKGRQTTAPSAQKRK